MLANIRQPSAAVTAGMLAQWSTWHMFFCYNRGGDLSTYKPRTNNQFPQLPGGYLLTICMDATYRDQ